LVPPKPVRSTQAAHPQGYCPRDSSRIGAASLRLNVSERCAHPMAEREKGATVMGSIQFKSLRRYLFCGLTLLVLVRLACAADAPPNLSPSEQFPVLGSRLRKRSGKSSLSGKSLPAVRPWDVNRRATPANISCTAPETGSFGPAGACSPRRRRWTVPATYSKASRCRTGIRSIRRLQLRASKREGSIFLRCSRKTLDLCG
jgi:hypothetical protein